MKKEAIKNKLSKEESDFLSEALDHYELKLIKGYWEFLKERKFEKEYYQEFLNQWRYGEGKNTTK